MCVCVCVCTVTAIMMLHKITKAIVCLSNSDTNFFGICHRSFARIYRVTPKKKKKKTEPINFFITSTKVKQNNSNSVFWGSPCTLVIFVYNHPRLCTLNVHRFNKKWLYILKKKLKTKKQTISCKNYNRYSLHDLALLTDTLAQVESLLHHLEQAAGDIGLQVNANKTEFMYFK